MATVIEKVSTRIRYPWHKWTDGKARRAKQGRDFNGKPSSFRNALYVRANRQELSVTVALKGDSVEFQFHPRARKRKSLS
jgi:hypothetical protein